MEAAHTRPPLLEPDAGDMEDEHAVDAALPYHPAEAHVAAARDAAGDVDAEAAALREPFDVPPLQHLRQVFPTSTERGRTVVYGTHQFVPEPVGPAEEPAAPAPGVAESALPTNDDEVAAPLADGHATGGADLAGHAADNMTAGVDGEDVAAPLPIDGMVKAERDAETPLREIADDDDTSPVDDRQCRICLCGPEEEAEYGRLISPCLCAGSMRYVHIQCINQWREKGANAKWYLECQQCGYEYHIRRTRVYGLARSRAALVILTSLIFLFMTLLLGHLLLKYLVAAAIEAEDAYRRAQAASKATAAATGADAKAAVHDAHLANDYWESDDGSVVVYMGGATFVYDVVVESIETFLIFAGDAYDVLREDGGWVSHLALEFVVRFLLGLAVMGSISFLTLLGSLSLFAPLQLMHTLRGTGIFDGIRRRLSGRNGTILVVAFVLVGIFNSIVQVYDFVQGITLRLLRYVETQIVEVNSPEGRRAEMARQAPAGWWERWWAERRWRNARGWYEVGLRGWVNVKERARQWRHGQPVAA